MDDCIFCKIVAGTIPSTRVFEDDEHVAFLDIGPLTRGHTLVVPKRHAMRMDEMEPEAVGRLFATVTRVLRASLRATRRLDSLVAVHNGPEAGQEVPHVHVHLVPRAAADGAGPIHALFANRPQVSKEDAESLAQTMEQQLVSRKPT